MLAHVPEIRATPIRPLEFTSPNPRARYRASIPPLPEATLRVLVFRCHSIVRLPRKQRDMAAERHPAVPLRVPLAIDVATPLERPSLELSFAFDRQHVVELHDVQAGVDDRDAVSARLLQWPRIFERMNLAMRRIVRNGSMK